jgi:mannan endo-1,4-beta-mannosidase
MVRRIGIVLAGLVALVGAILVVAQPAQAATGFYVSGGRLYDANGSAFVMRGVSHPYAWYTGQNSSFANIKSLGANTVRVVLDLNVSASAVSGLVSTCKSNRLICMFEIHSTTGYGDQSAATLSQAADYWLSIRSALNGQERYVLINIGNEPYGNSNTAGWTNDTANAIRKIRNGGMTHTLVVDGPNWGQDWSGVMKNTAGTVFAADTQRNTVFSVHMYGVYGQAATITSYLNTFVNAGLPIIIGEFGNQHSDGDVDEDTIMATAQSKGLGYLGWSWSGNGSPVQYLDMTNNFNPNSLTTWGQRIFNGANGIRSTSREASVFSGTTDPPPSGGGSVLRGTGSGRCLDVPNSSTANGTQVAIWDCSGNANQAWTATSAKQLQVYGNKCLDAYAGGTTAGTRAVIWDCNGGTNQQWNVNSNGTITGVQSGLCLSHIHN